MISEGFVPTLLTNPAVPTSRSYARSQPLPAGLVCETLPAACQAPPSMPSRDRGTSRTDPWRARRRIGAAGCWATALDAALAAHAVDRKGRSRAAFARPVWRLSNRLHRHAEWRDRGRSGLQENDIEDAWTHDQTRPIPGQGERMRQRTKGGEISKILGISKARGSTSVARRRFRPADSTSPDCHEVAATRAPLLEAAAAPRAWRRGRVTGRAARRPRRRRRCARA